MSIIGTPSFVMLLVLTNIALCLSVAHQRATSELRRPATVALSPVPLGGPLLIRALHRPDDGPLPVVSPLRID
jgi:hypothetical protein